MDRDPAKGRHLVGDGQPGQLVPEVHLVSAISSSPRSSGSSISASPSPRTASSNSNLRPRAGERHDRHHLLRGRGQPGRPGEHGVANRLGNFCGAGRERLGDEERIAPGHPIETLDIRGGRVGMGSRVVLGQRPDRRARQRRQVESPRSRRRSRVPEHDPERMAGRRLLGPIGHQHQRMAAVHATTQVPNEIQGRFIGPVRILDDEQIGLSLPRLPQGRQEAGEHVLTGGVPRPDAGGQLRQHLHQRAERCRSRRSIARSGSHRRRPGGVGEHLVDEGGLADAGSAGHENQTTVPVGRLGQIAGDGLQLHFPFEQRHKTMLRVRPSRSGLTPKLSVAGGGVPIQHQL